MWTKSELIKIKTLWDTGTVEEICLQTGVRKPQLMYIVHQMRKAGMKLAKKHCVGRLQNLIREVMAETK